MAKKYTVLLKRSNETLSEGEGKIPQPIDLEYGEIALNYHEGTEGLFIKNDSDEIVTFGPGEHVWEKGSGTNSIQQKGTGAVASGVSSVAEGSGTTASGIASHAEGQSTEASGTASHAEGYTNTVESNYAHIEGALNYLGSDTTKVPPSSDGSLYNTKSTGSHVEGQGNVIIEAPYSHVEGCRNKISKNGIVVKGVHVEGKQNVASGNYSHVEGLSNEVLEEEGHAEGYQVKVQAMQGHAEGWYTLVKGRAGHAEGYNTQAVAFYSHAEGQGSMSLNQAAHAEGENTQATGQDSHTEGFNTKTGGNDSQNTLSGGTYTKVGAYAHAEGNATLAQAIASHTEGEKTFATGRASHAEGNATTAFGEYSHAEGGSTTASNACSHAEGNETKAFGYCSHAEGVGTTAPGYGSHAEGEHATAQNEAEHAEGRYNKSNKSSNTYGDSGNTQHSIGIGASTADTKNAFEIMQNGDTYLYGVGGYDGTNATASTSNTLQNVVSGKQDTLVSGTNIKTVNGVSILGSGNLDTGNVFEAGTGEHSAVLRRSNSIASGEFAVAEGSGEISTIESQITELTDNEKQAIQQHYGRSFEYYFWGDWNSLRDGSMVYLNSDHEHPIAVITDAVFCDSEVQVDETYIFGVLFNASGATLSTGVEYYTESMDIDRANYAAGNYSHAEGQATNASGESSHAEGSYTTASGYHSHAEGRHTTASGTTSHAEGSNANANGDYSHAEGQYTTASGIASHAEGSNTKANGDYSHAEGQETTASGRASHAEGVHTTASREYSHAEGNYTTASGVCSHAEGNYTTASNTCSHAEGRYTTASGAYSHAEGSNTKARGANSHAEGTETRAYGYDSHAEGYGTISSNDTEHAEGRYNKSNNQSHNYGYSGNTQHSVGIGTSTADTKNAFEIMQNGNAYLYGVGGYDGTNPSSNNSLQKIFADISEIRSLSSSELDYILGIEGDASGAYIAALYIDDFEDGQGGNTYAEESGYHDIQEYISDVCNNMTAADHVGTNIFMPTCNVMEYEGAEYRVWVGFNAGENKNSIYALAPQNLDYTTLYNNSMEVNVNNHYCPFAVVFKGEPNEMLETYTDNLDLDYRLICVKTLEYSGTPIREHSSGIAKIYFDDFHEYGLYMSMHNAGVDTMDNYIQAVRDNDNPDQYWEDVGVTVEYEGVEYKFYADGSSNVYGGLLPMDMTYQDLYPHTLECDGHNINTPYSPFVVRWIDGGDATYEGEDPSEKYSTIIAID